MTVVVDYFSPHDRAFMDCLVQNGVAGIARYLTNSPRDKRQITPQEIDDAHAAGLAIHFWYEMNPTYPGYFTFAQGAEDCRQAVYRLQELGAPAGTVVYFTVDTNMDPQLADEYFNGVESMVTPQIAPGIYGYGRMVEHARKNYPNTGQHLAQTYSGRPLGPVDLWQHEQDALCGVSVDFNECSVAGWRPKENIVATDTPQLMGQSADLTLKANDVGLLQAVYHWPSGVERAVVRKVHVHAHDRRKIVVIYPPEDPDADETLCLDAEPALFVVDVVPE